MTELSVAEDRRAAKVLPPLPSTMATPLSIAMLAPCAFPTHQGTQVVIRHLATTLARAGHEIHLITYAYGEYEQDFTFHLHRTAKVTPGGQPPRTGQTLLKPAADAALMMTARRVVKAHGCNLLHVHNAEGLGIGALLKLQTSLPVVYHAHNAMGPELPTYFRAHMAQAFASVVGDVIDRTLPRAADAVITFDDDHKALHELYGVDADRVHVIPPGVDGEELRGADPDHVRAKSKELGEGPWILYAGNPDGYQNLPLLYEAFAEVRAQRPDVRLLVASSAPPSAFEDELSRASSRQGVVLHQHQSLEELRAIFSIATIAACPRALWTGAPIKLINYMAVGLPAVACRASARHILAAGSTFSVDDNPHAFANALLTLLKDPAKERDRQRRAFERFRVETHVPMYEAVYRSLRR